jgi:predicted transcriptional regulator
MSDFDEIVMESVAAKPGRLKDVWAVVATKTPVTKRVVKAALQRLRKSGRVRCSRVDGMWRTP